MKELLIEQKSILQNHKSFTYIFTDIDEAIEKINLFRRYRKMVLRKHKNFKFTIDIDIKSDKQKITVEVWTYPKSLEN